jgi:hypothetical protein
LVPDGNAATISSLVPADLTPEVLQFVISINATTYAEGAFANLPIDGSVAQLVV